MNDTFSVPRLEDRLAKLVDGLELIASRRLGCCEDGRDAAQETIVRVLERVRNGFDGDENELARIAYGVLRHVVADVHRLRAREVPAFDDLQECGPGPLERVMEDDELTAVRSAMARLPDSDRFLLTRCFVEGERVVAIAASLGEPPERVRKRKSRALERLANLIPVSRATPRLAPRDPTVSVA